MDCEADRERMDIADGTNDDWLKVLGAPHTNILPEGYKTAAELSVIFKISRRQLIYLVNKKIDEGLVDKIKLNIDGRITNAYKIKNPS